MGTKPNLPNQTYQTKPTKPNLPNQAKPTKSNVAYQSYLTMPTKPKLLVKAVNAWVCSAFGNVFSIISFETFPSVVVRVQNKFLQQINFWPPHPHISRSET